MTTESAAGPDFIQKAEKNRKALIQELKKTALQDNP